MNARKPIGGLLKRSGPLQRRARLKPVSAKRRKQNAAYRIAVKEYFEETAKRQGWIDGKAMCEVCEAESATENHHRMGRCGKLLCDKTHFLAVCAECHRKINQQPKWALERGYLELRGAA